MATRKIVNKHINESSSTYVGQAGELFYDTATNTLKISDGSTPGGTTLITDGGSAASITMVGDDSTGTTFNAGETIKIAGGTGITTAMSGDTLTITGSKDINVNSITSSDSSAIQINDAINVSGLLTANAGLTINNNSNTWTFGSTGITTFPGVINAGNINNLVVNDLGGGTSLTAGSQVQIGNSAGIAGAGVLIKNAVTNTLGGETSLEEGSKIQMDNGIVSLFGYTYVGMDGGDGLESRLVVEVDNSYLNKVVRIGTRIINTGVEPPTNAFQGITINQYGELTFPDATVQSTAARITIVGDDSTGVTLNAGETIKIAGTQNITTAVSGDTLTITGPNLSSYLTSVPKTIDVNEISSSDSSAIQINDSVNISGTLNAKTLIANTISSEDSTAIQINDGLRISGDLTFSNNTVQTTAYVTASGNWTVTTGTNTYSFTVPQDGTYTMWVKGNIANGIIIWNATVSVSNSNVAAIGYQYAWNYTGGGSPISLTAIPDQIRGSAGTISTDATYAGTTSNRFDFGIANSSGSSQTIYYGYAKIS